MAGLTRGRATLQCYSAFKHKHSSQSIFSRAASSYNVISPDATVQYPEIKPRWPPGKWSGLPESKAWELHEKAMSLMQCKTAKLRLEALAGTEDQYIFESKPYAMVPRRLNHYKFITKTHVLENKLPEIYALMGVDHIVPQIKSIVESDLNTFLQVWSERKDKSGIENCLNDHDFRRQFIGTILNSLLSQYGESNPHLLRSQYDENCRLETFWRRCGYKDQDDTPTDQCLSVGNFLSFHSMTTFQLRHRVDWQIRNELPLPLYVDANDKMCEGASVDYVYTPMSLGDLYVPDRPVSVSGVWINDPCEFTSLSVHCLGDRFKKFKQFFPDELSEHMTSVGLMGAFGSCVAQAHNQGFNWLMDPTYPFTTQSLVFDGKMMKLCAYQLNTTRLWVDDDNEPLQNLAWISEEIPLYDEIQNNRVEGLNEEALGLLTKCLLLEPSNREGIDLRPYLPECPGPRNTHQFMNNVGEEPWEKEGIGRYRYPRNSVYFYSFWP